MIFTSKKTPKPIDELWVRMMGGLSEENRQRLQDSYGIDMATVDDMQDDETYLYLPLKVMVRAPEGIAQRRTLLIVMGDDHLITVQDSENFPPFSSALRHIRRHPEILASSRSLLCLLLHFLNEQSSKVIAAVGNALEESSDTISEMVRALDARVEGVGVIDINEILIDLNKKEDLVSRCLESQLSLARAARYLDMEVQPSDELQEYVRTLRDDITGVKEHAKFEHDSVRYLQNALLASLNLKQNQIVKVFTIITAVFLPPTLIASIYGMNFTVMPELSWMHGFPVTIGITLVAALLPLLYINVRGWLR